MLRVVGTNVLASRPSTNVFLFNANSRGVIEATNGSPSMLTPSTIVGGAAAANVTQQIVPLGTPTAAYPWSFESTLKTPGIVLNSETISAAPRGVYSGFIPAGNTGVNSYFRVILDKAIAVTRVVVNAATPEAAVTTHAVIRVTDGSSNIDTTLVNGTQTYDSGALTQSYAAGANLDIRIATNSAGGIAAANIGVTVDYKMQ